MNPAAESLPLLLGHAAESPVAWRGGLPLPASRFIADVQAFAARLPALGACVNLCTDRYAFAVAFGAALLRERGCLLPPNARPETLAALRTAHGPMFVTTDDPALQVGGLDVLVVADSTAADGEGEDAGEGEGEGEGDADGSAMPSAPARLLAACLLTSGSTGQPQPHAKSWAVLHANTEGGVQRLCELLGRPTLRGLTLVATVPPQHSYGFESSVLLPMLGGAAFHAGRPFYPADIAAALAEVPRPRALVTTPFHLKALLSAGLALPPCDLVLSATAPLSPQLAREAESRFGGALIEIYGCTEAGQVATRRSAETDVWTTYGALRIQQQPAPDGQDAECFFVQGGHVHEATPLADLLKLEDDRRFRLLGRANDLIHVAGRRSSLGHLDYHLNSIEGVQDGAFWVPDEVPDAVVRPVAFVVAPELPREAIIAALRTRLEPPFVPRRVVHVAELPREATGKLTRETLRRFARSQLGLAE
jgi:acyl-coenzyme A synthetase/AMP-(fatty) acid ligase